MAVEVKEGPDSHAKPPGGYSRFQVTGWSNGDKNQNPKKIPRATNKPKKMHQNLTPKNPMPNFRTINDFQGNYTAGIRGDHTENYHESSGCFEYPKKSRSRKFLTQKHPSIILITWNPEYLPRGQDCLDWSTRFKHSYFKNWKENIFVTWVIYISLKLDEIAKAIKQPTSGRLSSVALK